MASYDHDDDDDEFITTISDQDEVPAEESDEEGDNSTKQSSSRLKRKHEDANPPARPGKKAKKNDKTSDAKSLASRTKASANGVAVGRESLADDDDAASEARDRVADDGAMNSDFEFEIGDYDTGVVEDFDGWEVEADPAKSKARNGDRKGVDIDELVAARRAARSGSKADQNGKAGEEESEAEKDSEDDEDDSDDELLAEDGFGMGRALGGSDDDDDSEEEGDDDESGSDMEDDVAASPVAHPADEANEEEHMGEDAEERAREQAFFAPEPMAAPKIADGGVSFQSMSLSRPILRGLASLNFAAPTPIQAKTIPVALLGKDVVGGAVTGSGKTAAFMIPILERLLYRPRKVPTTRVVVLMPTRELAVQCYNVARKLASHTDITFAQIVGGFSVREQESVLRRRPDVVIATPGRFIDHMRNSASFTIDTIEILVLDEADRMLEDGFADELNEILTSIPRSRQTMLFSATMTSRVDQLIRVGLQKPVRLLVDAQSHTAGSLTQEFVRIRAGREDKRLAHLMQLVTTVYTSKCIVFFRQKKEAHRVRVIFSLCDIKAAELHGNMSQDQRLAAVERFRSGAATHLLATDVASRGLDIRGVEAVLNYEAPQTHAIYLHRVGRTARMGRVGRACTLAGEEDRKVVRAVVKSAKGQGARVNGRTVDAGKVDEWHRKLEDLEDEIHAILDDEQQARALAQADMQVRKAENILEHGEEIASRPKRTWFSTEAQKAAAKKAGRGELNGEAGGKKKNGMLVLGKKVSNKDKKRADAHRERAEGGGQKLFKKVKEDRGKRSTAATATGAAAKARADAKTKKAQRAKNNREPGSAAHGFASKGGAKVRFAGSKRRAGAGAGAGASKQRRR